MFSWLTGSEDAPAITWTANADSPSGGAKKCCLSEPIEDMDEEKFKAMFWKWVENKPPQSQYQTSRDLTGVAGVSMAEELSFEASGLAGMFVSFKGTFYSKYKCENDELLILSYLSDSSMTNLSFKTSIKMLKEPFRLECYVDGLASRKSGPILRGALQQELIEAGYEEITVEADVDSPSEPGSKSVVTSVIEGITTESLFEKLKEKAVAAGTAEDVQEVSFKFNNSGYLMGPTSHNMYKLDKANDLIEMNDFGGDASFQQVMHKVFTRVGKDFRVERWAVGVASYSTDQGVGKGINDMYSSMKTIAAAAE